MNNASFGKRLLAYIVDMILISFIASLIFVFIPTEKVETKDLAKTVEKYNKGEITPKEYVKEIAGDNYKIESSRVPSYLVTLTLVLVYFVIFQFKNKGQTLGKKLMNIKVASIEEKQELHINDYLLRSLIINEMIFNILNVVAVFIFKGTTFTYVNSILIFLNMTILFITAIMVISRKDNRGIHDLLAKTKVVELEK